jgi:hypothetical protein
MTFEHGQFTMSYHQARDLGIDYRDFEKVNRLPAEVKLTAVAGVWGDKRNIRCLFIDPLGNGYMRNIVKWGNAGYIISELELDAKAIAVGAEFTLRKGVGTR